MIVLHQLMRVDISQLEPADVSAVDDLMKRYSGTIGFLPSVVLEEHLRKKWVLGATTKEGQLAGYLLYAAYPDRFRIVQLCVSDSHRNQGIARKLVEALKATATTQKVIRLSCRNDYEAHCMWPKLGFVPILEKAGRSRQGHLLTIWRLALAPEDQLALFRANISDDILDVVIDAQIFFDFNEPDNDTTLSSKTLLSDFLVDSIQIWFTDELFVEINRNQKDEERRTARDRAGQFLELRHDPILVKELEESLKGILPSHSQSQQSDINHLAKTAASDVKVFVTRDEALLKKAKEISNSLHVRILSPIELIMQQRELCEIEPYMPDRVAGLSLEWRRLNSNEFSDFPFNHFLEQGERKNRLRHKVESFLLDSKHEVEVLYSKNKPTAFRVVSYDSTKTLTVSLGRVGNAGDRSLFGRFLISDVIYKAMRKDLEMVKFEGSGIPTSLMQGLSEMGFTRCGDYFVRFCFTRHLDHQDILQEITELCPAAVDKYRRMPHLELERHCSPLISETDQDFFLIPIRKGYAFNLFDRQLSAMDLFGGNPDVLLRWSNAYYRRPNFHKMLKTPGRILWYISRDAHEIVAISHLDKVVIDTPRKLFQRFMKFGTLDWKDLFEMCKGDTNAELMALQFSHTFPLRRRVPLAEMWKVFDENSIGRSVQGPRKLSWKPFQQLFNMGYPKQP